MSGQFFYIELKFTPKIWTEAVPSPHPHEVVIEVPRDLVQSRQSASTHEKAIAIDLARRAALGASPTAAERILGLYDEDPPTWREDRPCDHQENGTRPWR